MSNNIEIGKTQTLTINRITSVGAFLKKGNSEVLLPTKYLNNQEVDDEITVFVYTDSLDRLIATTLIPKLECNQFASLTIVDKTKFGFFVDIGLEKHILLPFRESKESFEVGQTYLLYLTKDKLTNRLVLTSNFKNKFQREKIELEIGQKVTIEIYSKSNLGYNCSIENKYQGLLYLNEVFSTIHMPEQRIAYVKDIREDGKIDLTLNAYIEERIDTFKQRILSKLAQNKGVLNFGDKTEPEVIYKEFEMSKKDFKKAIGGLYKENKIEISDNSIQLKK
jgi:uncharacterized protein